MSAPLGGGPSKERLTASFWVGELADLLAMQVHSGHLSDPSKFSDLCFSLARAMDYAVASNEVPIKAQDLPTLVKRVYKLKDQCSLQPAVMVLMISVKTACMTGWFQDKDADILLAWAKEIGKTFSNTEDFCIGPSYALPRISQIMSRFYPRIKMGHILASLDVKAGYKAIVSDFHILKSMVVPMQNQIGLFVAQMNSINTSSCIMTPPRANFLLNGEGVHGRNNISRDTGPQLPTNITPMLKYGVNLFQVVGLFNGDYLIIIAVMSMMSATSETPALQDYVQPVNASLDSDSDIFEGPSRVSLNCPISHKRISTPVKGQLCKHYQCFDYENFMEMNSRRPSWHCPHCNQPVCHPDIRIDLDIAKMDPGWLSWKMTDCSHPTGNESQTPAISELSSCNSMLSPVLTDAVSPVLNRESLYGHGKSILLSSPRSQLSGGTSTATEGLTTHAHVSSSFMQRTLDSLMPGAASSANHQSMPSMISSTNGYFALHGSTEREQQLLRPLLNPLPPSNLASSSMQNHLSPSSFEQRTLDSLMPGAASSANHQSMPSMVSSMNGYFALHGSTEREQQLLRPLLNPLPLSNLASSSMQNHLSPQNWDGDTYHYVYGQAVRPATSHPAQSPGADHIASSFSSGHQSTVQSSAPQLRTTLAMTQSRNPIPPTCVQSVQFQQGEGGDCGQAMHSVNSTQTQLKAASQLAVHKSRTSPFVPVQLQPSRTRTPAFVPNQLQPSRTSSSSSHSGVSEQLTTTSGQRGSMGETTQPVLRAEPADGSATLNSGRNWQPSGRMRGSLIGEAYAAALRQFMLETNQPTQVSQMSADLISTPDGALQMQGPGPVSSSSNAQSIPQAQSSSRPGDTTTWPESWAALLERSLGMH